MVIKKAVLISVIACILVGGIWLMFENKDDKQCLVVGIMSGYEPFAYLSNDGTLCGFDIDVAYELSKRLGKKVTFKDLNVAALLLALDQGKIDVLLSGLSITQERERKIAMIYYQGSACSKYPLLFWKSIPKGVASLDDLARNSGAIVSVEPGSCQEKFLLSCKQPFSVKTTQVMSDIVLDLKYGKSTAALVDPDILPELKRKNPELVNLEVQLPVEYQSRGCGIGVNKRNIQLVKNIEQVVAGMLDDGTLARLEQKWFVGAGNE